MAELADKEKEKALQLAISQIEKQFGKGAIIRLGDKPKVDNYPVIPTGALTLDLALGIGGIPYGRVSEIYGPEASGKTTLTLNIIAECQKQGGTAAFIDAEHALDAQYARAIGVDIDNLLLSQPDTGEQALEIVESLVRSGAVNLIVVDSVAALVPKSEIEGNMGDAVMGMQARLMSQALRKLTAIINKSQCALVFINQIRMKIGVMYGNPETTTGGMALKFYSTVRIEIRKKDVLKRGDEVYGNLVRAKVVKNKLAAPFKVAEFEIIFGEGISKASCLVNAAMDLNIIQRKGTWYFHGDDRIGQGRESVVKALTGNPEFLGILDKQIRELLAKEQKGEIQITRAVSDAGEDSDSGSDE
ncbi:MAG: recombinase RecA [Brevinematales bacterium]|nr:recombinase RecA [Brevinematales bacterium]